MYQKTGKSNSNWKGGRIFDGRYWKVKVDDHPAVKHLKPKHRYVLEHRLVMEKHLGRYLKSDEFVLFKDNDSTNIKLNNLILSDSKGQNKVHKRVKTYLAKGKDSSTFTNKKYL